MTYHEIKVHIENLEEWINTVNILRMIIENNKTTIKFINGLIVSGVTETPE